MKNNYQQYLNRKRAQYGEKFDPSELSAKFIPYFESQQRIEIETSYGEKQQGYIGITTGWKPIFILVHNARNMGSSNTLSDTDTITRTFNTYR